MDGWMDGYIYIYIFIHDIARRLTQLGDFHLYVWRTFSSKFQIHLYRNHLRLYVDFAHGIYSREKIRNAFEVNAALELEIKCPWEKQ